MGVGLSIAELNTSTAYAISFPPKPHQPLSEHNLVRKHGGSENSKKKGQGEMLFICSIDDGCGVLTDVYSDLACCRKGTQMPC